jgi:hypothetical protein
MAQVDCVEKSYVTNSGEKNVENQIFDVQISRKKKLRNKMWVIIKKEIILQLLPPL